MIPLSIPVIQGNEWQYVKECLDTGWVSSVGKFVDRFEQEVAHYTGAKHAIACVNGTAALQIALQLVGVQPGDEVIVPTVTFIATVNVVRYAQAEPVFMDCDEFYNLDVKKLQQFLGEETVARNGSTHNRRTGRRIAAIMPVHVFGNACRLDTLLPLCKERGIAVVEDAAESIGTHYVDGSLAGRYTGTIGDVGCLSFNGNKIITTGGGGMILTNHDQHAVRARYLTTQAKNDELRFVHDEVGYNYRLTNVHAAMGVAQLEQLPRYIEIKKRNFQLYQKLLADVAGMRLIEPPPYANNNHWMYPLQVPAAMREPLMSRLGSQQIQTRPLWYLNHLQKPYAHCQHYRVEQAVRLWETTLNVPCSVNLTETDIQQVVAMLRKP